MLRFVILVAFVSQGYFSYSQVRLEEEPTIKEAMEKYEKLNLDKKIVKAWRIQIITTNDRREMDQARLKFERLYPHIKQSWEHNAPYYQVRVGAYEKKEDLEAFLLELKKQFPSALPVHDDIEEKELIDF